MLPDELEKNISMIMAGRCDKGKRPFKLSIAKNLKDGVIDILEPEWQKSMEAQLEGIDLVIIDNFYCLTENKISSMKPALAWINKLRKRDIAVLVIDHTNREGELQGSIAKERATSLSIKLETIGDPGENLIEVIFPVARSLPYKDIAPFTLRKVFTKDTFHFELAEGVELKKAISNKIKILALIKYLKEAKEFSFYAIEAKTGIPHSTAQYQYAKRIPKLSLAEKALIAQEIERLVAEDGEENTMGGGSHDLEEYVLQRSPPGSGEAE